MLAESREALLARTPDDALILDVGGWGSPLSRADWVLDLLPYDTRGLYAYSDDERAKERFSQETWIVRDICDRQPWPFSDNQFDVAVCSHTLEDIRDPIWVCQELSRVARAGYIEVPSRLEEQIHGFNGPWVGWSHHRWLIEESEGALVFQFKPHEIHGRPEYALPHRLRDTLAPRERVVAHWWEGSVSARERIIIDPAEQHENLAGFVRDNLQRVPPAPPLGLKGHLRKSGRKIGRRLLG